MNRKLRLTAQALTLTVALTTLTAGCGSSSGDTASTAAPQATAKANANLNPTGFPIVKEPVTIKIFGQKASMHGPWDEMLVFKEYEKMTNVKVVFETAPDQGFQEKKNLLFASNELPDAFMRAGLTPDEITKYGLGKSLVPLEDLIAKNGQSLTKLLTQYPDAKKTLVAPDGHIYAFPAIVTLNAARTGLKPWINKTWLEKVNKKAPTTLEELTDVLRAFKSTDLNGNGKADEIPLSSCRNDANARIMDLVNVFAGSFGLELQMGYNVNIKDNKTHIWLTDDRFKELLQYMNSLYKEGLLDKEIFTQEYAKYLSKLNTQQVGVFFIQTDDSFDSKNFQGMAPFKGPHGDQMVSATGPVARDTGTFAITNKNKYPAETLRWVDYFYSEEGSVFLRYGVEGKTYRKQADGSVEYNDEILTDKRGKSVAIGQFTIWPGGGAPHWINDKNSTAINSKATQQAQQALEPYLPKAIYGAPLFDDASREKVLTVKADISKYLNEAVNKFIMGDLPFSKWDEYTATMKKLGLQDLETIYQKSFDNMNN